MSLVSAIVSRAQSLAVDAGFAPDYLDLISVLRALGTDEVKHGSSRTLMSHLLETQRILAQWQQAEFIQNAGLFHSIYSTPTFHTQVLRYSERSELRALIGTKAESVVYLYSLLTLDAIELAWMQEKGDTAQDTISVQGKNGLLLISVDILASITFIHLANTLEQTRGPEKGPTKHLSRIGSLGAALTKHCIGVPEAVRQLGSLTPASEIDLCILYERAMRCIGDSPEQALVLFEQAANVCVGVPEPLLWRSYLKGLTSDRHSAQSLATEAKSILVSLGTPWDKRLPFSRWQDIAEQLLIDPSAPAVNHEFRRLYEKIGPPVSSITTASTAGDTARFSKYLIRYGTPDPPSGMGMYPGLSKQAFLDPSVFAMIAALESRFEEIKKEAKDIGSSAYRAEAEPISRVGSWDVFFFYERGKKNIENCRLCPTITSIIEEHPAVTTMAGLIYLSKLAPGTVISRHQGPTNIRVRCHLGIDIPTGECRLEVNGEVHQWNEGKCIVFDDSFEHRVWNLTDQERLILIVDLWHPDLTALEISLIRGLHGFANSTAETLVRYWQRNNNAAGIRRVEYD